MTDDELQEVEKAAAELARKAGGLLMGYFDKPLEVTYKSPNNRSPVTDADRASDDYLRGEILRRFPDHTVLSEETSDDSDVRSRVTWVVDPLDGTNNFMNGLPIFGVSIGVVEDARPVVGAIFLPSIHTPEGNVFYARLNGGAKRDGVPLALASSGTPGNNLLAALPAYFWRMYGVRPPLRGNLGEVRSTGSIAFELAMVSQGVFQYALFNGPKLWDVAGGIVLVHEAGGSVLVRQSRTRSWQELERFQVPQASDLPTHGELRDWRATLVLGPPEAASFVAAGLQPRTYQFRRLWRRVRRSFQRSTPAAQASAGQSPTTNATASGDGRGPDASASPQPGAPPDAEARSERSS